MQPWLDPIVVSASLHAYVSQDVRGTLVMGASLDPYELSQPRSTFEFLEEVSTAMVALFPALAPVRIVRQWAGIADMTPDFSPIMGPTEVDHFYLDAEKKQELPMRREPALRYPAPPEDYWGEIYVWTDRGIPAVVGGVFEIKGRDHAHQIFHEFHSLARQPLFEVGGETGWQPEEDGIKLRPVPDATEPDDEKVPAHV